MAYSYLSTADPNEVSLGGVTVKAPKLTKRRLRNYLAKNPNRLHVCGDVGQCVIADYYLDTAKVKGELPEGQVLSIYTGSRETQFKVVERKTYPGGGYFDYTKHTAPRIIHEPWVSEVIDKFDRLKGSGRVRSTTVLKRLADLLTG